VEGPVVGGGADPDYCAAGARRTDVRRRRRSGGTWFPTIGAAGEGEAGDNFAGRQFNFTFATASAASITAIAALTIDQPLEGDEIDTLEGGALAKIIGSEYVLKRVVGKMLVERTSVQDANGNDPNPAVLFGAGLFVARADDTQDGATPDRPVGSAGASERRDNYGVLETDTIREPWIWRRLWILGTAGANRGVGGVANSSSRGVGAGLASSAAQFPASTALYGSVADGPHVDSRVKRRVSGDNRLWLSLSVVPWPLGAETNSVAALFINGYFDYRIFGSLRKARASSAF